MTQEELLKIIRQEPGIELPELRRRVSISSTAVNTQVRALEKRGLIIKKATRSRITWSLFPVAENKTV